MLACEPKNLLWLYWHVFDDVADLAEAAMTYPHTIA